MVHCARQQYTNYCNYNNIFQLILERPDSIIREKTEDTVRLSMRIYVFNVYIAARKVHFPLNLRDRAHGNLQFSLTQFDYTLVYMTILLLLIIIN